MLMVCSVAEGLHVTLHVLRVPGCGVVVVVVFPCLSENENCRFLHSDNRYSLRYLFKLSWC